MSHCHGPFLMMVLKWQNKKCVLSGGSKNESGLMEQKYCAGGEIDLTQSKQRAVLGA